MKYELKVLYISAINKILIEDTHIEMTESSRLQTDLSTGKSMSYSQLLDAIDRVASALKRRGLKANDVVLVMASNHVETAVFFLSVWRAGGINACLTLSLLPGAEGLSD